MSVCVLDVETTTHAKGNPFSRRNKLVCVGLHWVKENKTEIFYEEDFESCRVSLSRANHIVAFNAKFDVHWCRRYSLLPDVYKVWDCQLWEFLESNQQWRYPDLDTSVKNRNLGEKLNFIEENYWSKGIDTDQIPRDELSEYLARDLEVTKKLFLWQLQQKRSWDKLFQLQCADLLVLEEMEWNGLILDVEKCNDELQKSKKLIQDIEQELSKGYEGIPINFDSVDHMSAYLYGGCIVVEDRVPIGVFKTGAKIGQPRYKLIEYKYELPQLVKPSKKFALKKEGLYSTSADALRSINPTKRVQEKINMLQEREKHQKLVSTYFEGIQETIKEKDWNPESIHSQLNQCVAQTGRLSSSAPNQQNIPEEFKQLLVSRFDNQC